jgi:hypothetical protein
VVPAGAGLGSGLSTQPVRFVATDHGATAAQVAIAWLLQRSRVIAPIPGTASVAHLEENPPPRRSHCPPTSASSSRVSAEAAEQR